MNIISLADFRKIPSISLLDDDVMVIRTNDIPFIPKPSYPVRIKYFLFVYCSAGSMRFSIDTKMYTIHEGEFLLTAADSVMEFFEMNNIEASLLIVSNKYMKALTVQCTNIWKRLAAISQDPIHEMAKEEEKLVTEYFDKLSKYCRDASIKFRHDVVCHQIIALLHEVCGFQSVVNIAMAPMDVDRNRQIYSDFMKLVIHHFKKEHTVAFYAEKMNLTPKYLSMAVKTASGNTPSDCIQKFLIQEAMVLLKNTNMTMKEIVSELNFPTATFFCRYFKRNTGKSPLEYRKSL